MTDTFKEVLSERGIRGLYRGINAPIIAEAPKRAWKVSAPTFIDLALNSFLVHCE